jgi:parallel beta-helix repeat protein
MRLNFLFLFFIVISLGTFLYTCAIIPKSNSNDDVPPKVYVLSPVKNSYYYSNLTIHIQVNEVYEKGKSVSFLDKVRVKIVSYADNSELYNKEFKLSGYEGEVVDKVNLPLIFSSCSIFVEAYDSSGNVGRESFDFYIEGVPDFYVSISSPVRSFSWFITNVSHFALIGNVNISTSYYGDISNIWVVLSNSTALYSNSIGNFQSFYFETNFGSLEENNWVYVYVLSTSNYWANSWIKYVYDTNKPFVLILDPTNNQTIAARYDVVVSNYDIYGVVSSFLMVVDENNNTNIYTVYYSSYPFVYRVSFSNGTNKVIAYAKDVAGNEGYTNVTIIVDESIPWVVISNTSPVYVGVSNNVVTYGSSGVGGGSVITNIRLFVYTNSVIGYSTNVGFSSSDVTFSISHPVFMGTNVVGVVAYADNGKVSATNYYTVIADYMKPFVNFILTNDEIVVTDGANNFNLVLEVGDTNYSLGGFVYIYVTNYPSGNVYYASFWASSGVWTNTSTITLLGGRNDISVFYVDSFSNSSSTNLTNVYCFDNAVYVATDGNDSNHGTIYDPLKSVQAGVNKAYSLGVMNVKVKQGVYTPGNGLNSSSVGVVLSNMISLLGGYNSDFSSISGFSTFDGGNLLNHVIVITNTTNVIKLQNIRIIGGSNTSTTYPDNHGGGILIANVTSLVSFYNVMVYNNYSLFGGGIGVVNSSNRIVFVSPVEIYGNVSSNGGGIAFSQSTNNVTAPDNINISSNNSIYGGGVSVIDSKVSLGSLVRVRYNSSQFGGGIYLTNSSNSEIYAQVYGNSANYGGGLYLYNLRNTTISGSVYSNSAYYNGGGLYLWNSTSNTISGSVYGNSANNRGGGLYLWNSTSNTISSSVHGNRANSSQGGGLYLSGSTYTTISGSVYGNSANDGGGGVYLWNSTSNTISGDVYGNSASYGGGLALGGSPNTTISGSVYGNSATTIGGGLYLSGSTYTTISGSVYSNSANYGGGLNLYNSLNTTISGSVYGNSANYDGGGVYLLSSSYNTISGSVYDNTASSNSGGIMLRDSSNNVISANVYSNISHIYDGGGIRLIDSHSNFISGQIYNNKANSGFGGGIEIYRSTNNVIVGDIYMNFATWGGGLSLRYSASNFISNNIYSNQAGWAGGGVFLGGVSNNSILSHVFDNSASIGGGFVVERTTNQSIGGFVYNNKANLLGGGIYVEFSSNVIITANVYSNVSQNIGGGGIHTINSYVSILSGSVSYNVSSGNGGGIALYLSSGILSNVYFTNNISSNFGGAVYVGNGSGEIKLLNSVFFGNWSKDHGGAIYGVNTTNFTIQSNVFTNNYSSSTNTVITIASSISNLSNPFGNLKFITNVFSGYGSNSCAIWEDDLVVTNTSFDNDIKNHTIRGNIFYTNTFSYIYRDINVNSTLPKAPGYIYSNSVDSLNSVLSNSYHDADPSSDNVGY